MDHGHDEESRNGREVKIDILEGYIRTPEWFRSNSGIFRSTEGLPEPPAEVLGQHGPKGERGKPAGVAAQPPPRESE
jgi:hypothetical protein